MNPTAPVGAPGDPLLAATETVGVLLVEDDAGDAFLVSELLAEADAPVDITWKRNLHDALDHLQDGIRCVLLDLGLPDADGLDGLHRVLRAAPQAAVLVLTGLDDAHRGAEAVAAGAQDYLVKHQVDGHLLARAIRYAVERKRADDSQRRLVASELHAAENARLQRGLLPTPLLTDPSLEFLARYRPGSKRALLGGDFYDAVQTGDGTVHVMIGDGCGHGPDEAALGVSLRIAWRTLILAGRTGSGLLGTLDQVLVHERRSEELFATLCMLSVAPSRDRADVFLAGHPAPLLLGPGGVTPVPDDDGGVALGLLPDMTWPAVPVHLDGDWGVLLYTDGLIEGYADDGPDRVGPERLGTDRLAGLVRAHLDDGHSLGRLIDDTIATVEGRNGGPLTDDLAVLLVAKGLSL